MELTLQQILDISGAADIAANAKMPSRTAYTIMLWKRKTKDHTEAYVEAHNALIEKYAPVPDPENPRTLLFTDADGKPDAAKCAAFVAERNVLLAALHDVELRAVKVADFDGAELPPAFFQLCEPLITD